MAVQKLLSLLVFQLVLVAFVLDITNAQGLKVGFYSNTCPNAEKIVKKTVTSFISRSPSLAGPLLRMFFHDCFVRGCDGSVLLNSTSSNQAEKDAFPNLSLRGYPVIDAVKAALEQQCRGVVSCADIIALVARDAVSLTNGPFWQVPTGRRDGRVSKITDALNNLPPPSSSISTLKSTFAAKGLTVKDLVVLSGAHTIGVSHCTSFANRLYNFTGKNDSDPSMDPNYVAQLKTKCKPNDATTIVEMDPGSSEKFDVDYYTLVSKRRGLFQSDAALLSDSTTKAYVQLQLTSKSTFAKDFGASMVNMGKISVLTGKSGEIRKKCYLVN